MLWLLWVVPIWVVLGTFLTAWINREELRSLWREPALKRPVLIVESDDWGAGPLNQAEQLYRIAGVLSTHADRDGRRPVMTLGLVLGVADGERIVAQSLRHYHRKSLDDLEFTPILTAIRRGTELGVFALQLHGGEHYWPPALLAAARNGSGVSSWLGEAGIARTEALPATLQSRWIDASVLPSRSLSTEESRVSARAEAEEYRKIFGREPVVAVPPTFIWNAAVEAGWAEGGVRVVVTPGRRYEARAARGEPCSPGSEIRNGEQGVAGITYVVRDDYFEPARGHKAERALEALAAKTRLGRPTLLETHRTNFLGDERIADAAVAELERLLRMVLDRFPAVVFLCTEELASHMRRKDPWLVEHGFAARLHVWLRRLWQVGRLRRLVWLTGVIVPGWLLYAMTRAAAPEPSGV